MVARVLYRDGLMLVIDKPAGFAVHRGPKGGESLEDYFGALRFGLPRAPALAHRLDRETSGCLVLGRHRKALQQLGRLFRGGHVGKTYWAVVEGGPEEAEGRVDLPLGRLDPRRGWWMKPDKKGLPAVTMWKVLGRASTALKIPTTSPLVGKVDRRSVGEGGREGGEAPRGVPVTDPPPQPSPARREGAGRANGDGVRQLTWLALEPLTGRTHQLRVHCAAKGWPIAGDAIYGAAPRSGGPGLQLHSRAVAVPLYKNREPVRVIAPVPRHMAERLRACGWVGESDSAPAARRVAESQ